MVLHLAATPIHPIEGSSNDHSNTVTTKYPRIQGRHTMCIQEFRGDIRCVSKNSGVTHDYDVYLQLSAAALYFGLTWKRENIIYSPTNSCVGYTGPWESGFMITLIGARVSSFPFIFPSQTEKAKPKSRQPEPWLFPGNHQGVGLLPRGHFLVKVNFPTTLPRPLPPQPAQ